MTARRDILAFVVAFLGLAMIAETAAQSPPQPAVKAPLVQTPKAPASLSDTVDAYAAVFDAWVKKHRPTTAILVVRRQGKTVFLKGHGVDPRAPSFIGSMSKAITGACVATLIRDGKLSFTTPMRQALAGFFRRHGPPSDRRFENVTIEQLLTHHSGLRGNEEGDPIHDIWRRRAERGMGHLVSPEPLLVEHLKTRLLYNPGTKESYSNIGFVVLTAAIEEAARKPYETYCREAVFDKLGITSARLHPDWRQFSGAGGWIIAGADYLVLLEVFDRKNPFLGDTVKAWIAQAQTRWNLKNRDSWESLGLDTTNFPEGWRVMHRGMLNSRGRDPNGRPTAAIISSFAYREPRGISVFHAMTPAQKDDKILGELDHAVHRTHDVVKRLP